MLLLGMARLGICQTPQQHVYATGTGLVSPYPPAISGFDKNSLSGALTAIPLVSPFPAHSAAPMAVDGQGKFLFVAGPSSIAMYAIDPASGALTEVPRSPIPYVPIPGSEQAPSNPLSIATEPTGKFVYVGFQSGDFPGNPYGNSSITPYVIDTSNATLGPTLDLGPQWSLEFNAQPTNLFVEPSGRHLYAALGAYSNNLYAGFDVYDIDGNTGELDNLSAVDTVGPSQVSAMDPKGRFLFQAYGEFNSWLSSFQLSPADGSVTGTSSIFVDYTALVHAMVVDPSGNFLYVSVGGAPASFNTYSIDQTTGALALLSSSTQIAFPFGQWTVADPQGPYLYTLLNGSVHGFQADSTTGAITELSGSPFTDSSSNYYETGLYITNTNPQASSGPYLEISGGGPFPQTPVGTTSPQTITVTLTNIGDVTMSLSSLAIAGDSTHSFSETNNCPNTLVPQASCQATLFFTPAVTGVLQATLQITDNAPGSPQSVTLSGVGVSTATQPQVSLSSSSLGFGSQTQGTSSAPQVITLTNTGNATLHVSVVTLTGSYPKDWTQTNTCAAPLAAQGTCTISVTFSPSDNGVLSASITVTDDAPNSPQAINLYGNAPPAVLLNASTNGGSTVATVPAGQIATYNLQAMPGPNFTGTITFACSGVPFGAQCTVPASVAVTNGAATPFTVSISTLSPSQAAVFPGLARQSSGSLRPQASFSLAFLATLLLLALTLRSRMQSRAPRWLASVTAAMLMTALVFSGIGCGSAGSSQSVSPPPPQSAATPVITPASGTFYAAQSVAITDATAGASIHYTTDGSTPAASSPTYLVAIPLISLTTVQAMAMAPNYANSAVASATLKFQTPSGTITLTSTATPSGSSKQLPLTPILLTLNVQ
jgi:6-phosphogluconolactonase (cycloisomerase 2 family)